MSFLFWSAAVDLRGRLETDYQELQEIIEHMHTQKGLLTTMDREQTLMTGAPEEIREKLLQEILVLDDRISAEGAEVFDKRKK